MLNVLVDKVDENCTGLIFKARVNHFLNKRGDYNFNIKMELQTRKSCKCNKCFMLLYSYNEYCSFSNPLLPINIKNNNLYSLKIVNESRDYETGIIDDYDFTFFEIT